MFTLLSGFMIGSTLIVSPASGAEQNAWLAFIIGLCGGAILINMYIFIAKLNPYCTLISILEKNFGKVLGRVISVMYIWYFIHLAALVLRNFGAYSVATSYAETPMLFIIICIALVIVYSVRAGIEVMGRISEVFMVIISIILFFVFFALIKEFEIDNLKPVLSQGMKPVIKSAFAALSFPFGETVVFLMIFPHVNKQKYLYKSSYFALFAVGILLLGAIIRNLMVLGADMVSRDVFPSHIVFRLIPGMDLDQLLDVNLTVSGIIKVGVCIYAAATGVSELLGEQDYKIYVVPLSAFIVALSIWLYDSLMEMLQWAIEIWPYYSIPFQIIIPMMLLLISLVKNNIKQKSISQSNKTD